jgi:hypothetical protein
MKWDGLAVGSFYGRKSPRQIRDKQIIYTENKARIITDCGEGGERGLSSSTLGCGNQPKALVVSKYYHVAIATIIRVKKLANDWRGI